ncbi:hypothetical protein cypCar_00015979 [Cyprinus carpio]|nr:hypothetical protein cypCar_00015979 [Cyprinus carpio]
MCVYGESEAGDLNETGNTRLYYRCMLGKSEGQNWCGCVPWREATLSVVNVSALPDKGERLKSQVKELEEALESLSLTAASLSLFLGRDQHT